MKKLFFALTVIFILTNFFACSFESDIEDIVSAPVNDELIQKIKLKMEEMTDDDYALVYSSRGKYQNPIIFFDINGDGHDEVIVAYRSSFLHPDSANNVCFHIFTVTDGEPTSLFDIIGNGATLDNIYFYDFNGDNIYEFLVGYISTYENKKTFTVYMMDFITKSITRKYGRDYTEWALEDITGDGKKDIIFINYDFITTYAYARIGMYDSRKREFYDVECKNNLIFSDKFFQMTTGKINKNNIGIFISAGRSVRLSSVEILIWEDESLVNKAYYNEPDYPTKFNGLLDSHCSLGYYLPQYINNDGIIEVPLCYELDESKISRELMHGDEKLLYVYDWCNYVIDEPVEGSDELHDGFSPIFKAYINDQQNYILILDKMIDASLMEDFRKNIKAYIDYKGDIYFYYLEEGVNSAPSIDRRVPVFCLKRTVGAYAQGGKQIAFLRDTNLYYSFVITLEEQTENYDFYKKYIPEFENIQQAFMLTNILKAK